MKRLQMVLIGLGLTLSFTFQAFADSTPVKVSSPFGKIYVPQGFDNNDNVQVVGEGLFSNSCYRNAETLVRVDAASKAIYFAPMAYKYDGLCLQVMLPFDRVVDIGILNEGQYTLMDEKDHRVLGRINVGTTATKEPDDAMYAPISQAFVQTVGNANKVYLTGDFPLSCMKIKEVRFQVQPEVLVVLPLAEIDSSVPCSKGKFHFEVATDVGTIKPGRYLLHVRSMNGKAINNLFDAR